MHPLLSALAVLIIATNKATSQFIGPEESVEDEVSHFLSNESPAAQDSDETVTNNEHDSVPPEIRSVSQFITEFHKKIEGDTGGGKMLTSVVDEQVAMGFFSGLDDSEGLPVNPLVPYYPLRHLDTPVNSSGNATAAPLVNCDRTAKYNGSAVVEIVNTTRFIQILKTNPNITHRSTPAVCLVALFYAPTCSFSASASPHYNALPRAFPSLRIVAVNAMRTQMFNTQFGIVGVPTVLLLHNGRPAAKFNSSEYTLEEFALFITKYTAWTPEEKMFVSSADFGGPVPAIAIKEQDKWLLVAWLVVIGCTLYAITKTKYWHWFIESAKNTWREAEAAEVTHEHNE